MTKEKLVAKMAEDAQISKIDAYNALHSFMDGVAKTLKKRNGRVSLIGFGSFTKKRRKAREGRHPQTGEKIKIKAKNVVKFTPGKALRETI